MWPAIFLAVAAISALVWALRTDDDHQAAAATLIASSAAVCAVLVAL